MLEKNVENIMDKYWTNKSMLGGLKIGQLLSFTKQASISTFFGNVSAVFTHEMDDQIEAAVGAPLD